MNVKVVVGQRYLYKSGRVDCFIGEIEKVKNDESFYIRIVQILNWKFRKIGHVYREARIGEGYILLEGQDAPISRQII